MSMLFSCRMRVSLTETSVSVVLLSAKISSLSPTVKKSAVGVYFKVPQRESVELVYLVRFMVKLVAFCFRIKLLVSE